MNKLFFILFMFFPFFVFSMDLELWLLLNQEPGETRPDAVSRYADSQGFSDSAEKQKFIDDNAAGDDYRSWGPPKPKPVELLADPQAKNKQKTALLFLNSRKEIIEFRNKANSSRMREKDCEDYGGEIFSNIKFANEVAGRAKILEKNLLLYDGDFFMPFGVKIGKKKTKTLVCKFELMDF